MTMKDYKSLTDVLATGRTNNTIHNAESKTLPQVHEEYRKLLEPLVKDEDLLVMIATEHNMMKPSMRVRLEHHGILKDAQGSIIGKFHVPPGSTTWEVINELREALPKGKSIDIGHATGSKRIASDKIHYIHNQVGIIDDIDLTTVFRKG